MARCQLPSFTRPASLKNSQRDSLKNHAARPCVVLRLAPRRHLATARVPMDPDPRVLVTPVLWALSDVRLDVAVVPWTWESPMLTAATLSHAAVSSRSQPLLLNTGEPPCSRRLTTSMTLSASPLPWTSHLRGLGRRRPLSLRTVPTVQTAARAPLLPCLMHLCASAPCPLTAKMRP